MNYTVQWLTRACIQAEVHANGPRTPKTNVMRNKPLQSRDLVDYRILRSLDYFLPNVVHCFFTSFFISEGFMTRRDIWLL
jgi:hypothetical protein